MRDFNLGSKPFVVVHYDSLTSRKDKVGEEDTLVNALCFVDKEYRSQLNVLGHSYVEVVDQSGETVWKSGIK